ncbi:hypothetical protein VR45_18020 [Streptomyces sp. NRRL S-495]|nr:hypothetical protein VR45_18020 [Streptomyces sp. NRRL S-495]
MLARETGWDARTVPLRPELVVEVAFDGLQHCPPLPRRAEPATLARVVRYRPEQSTAGADTVASARELATAEGLWGRPCGRVRRPVRRSTAG